MSARTTAKQKGWMAILLLTTTLGTLVTLQLGSVFLFMALAVLVGYSVRFVRLTKKEVALWVGLAILMGVVAIIAQTI